MTHLPTSVLPLDLPPRNPYIPTQFELKPLPTDDAAHPLLNCSLKVCITVGKKKSWFPAAVTQYKMEGSHLTVSHQLLLSYEDEDEKWHSLDFSEDLPAIEAEGGTIEPGYEGTMDEGSVKFRVLAVPREGEGVVLRYGDVDHDDDVEVGIAFPPIPPPAPATRLPQLVYNNNSLKVWHVQDRKFKRPLADLRIKIECDGVSNSALNQACMDLFCRLCADALTETCYLASVCELGSSIFSSDTGFSIRLNGFDHKLLDLAKEVLGVVMSFRGRDGESVLPSTIKEGRFDACLEVLLRKYRNAGMNASGFCTSLRLLCLRPSMKSANAKLKALQGFTEAKFAEVMYSVLKKLSVECFYHGNADRDDAEVAADIISTAITCNCNLVGIPRKKLPSKLVIKAPPVIDHHLIVAPTLDPKDSNTAVEVYFQIGKDDLSNRVLIDLLAHILDEPLYNQLRTKEQVSGVKCVSVGFYDVLLNFTLLFVSSQYFHTHPNAVWI